jgi:ParB family chromosome partitioning protein
LGLTGLQQDQAAERVAQEGLSVRAIETLVRQLLAGETPREKVRIQPDADVQTLQRRLMDHLGASTLIKQKRNGTGEVIIKYASLEELDGVLRRIKLPD